MKFYFALIALLLVLMTVTNQASPMLGTKIEANVHGNKVGNLPIPASEYHHQQSYNKVNAEALMEKARHGLDTGDNLLKDTAENLKHNAHDWGTTAGGIMKDDVSHIKGIWGANDKTAERGIKAGTEFGEKLTSTSPMLGTKIEANVHGNKVGNLPIPASEYHHQQSYNKVNAEPLMKEARHGLDTAANLLKGTAENLKHNAQYWENTAKGIMNDEESLMKGIWGAIDKTAERGIKAGTEFGEKLTSMPLSVASEGVNMFMPHPRKVAVVTRDKYLSFLHRPHIDQPTVKLEEL